jgi:DNA ligase-1
MKKFKPMLAGKVDLTKLRYPVFASPKIDGVRAVVIDGKVLSRKLEVFPNEAAQQFAEWEGLDGELIIGNPTDQQVRNVTSGTLNRKTDVAEGLKFYVFDFIDTQAEFAKRLRHVEATVILNSGNIFVVPHLFIDNERQLLQYEEFKLDEGYEGLILRSPTGPYKFGRSTTNEGWMLKLKRFEDAEARVLRVNEEMENTNVAERDNLGRTKRSKSQAGLIPKGRAGELEVVGINGRFHGVEFVVPLGGAGDVGKAEWWRLAQAGEAAGEIVTYRFFNHGIKDKPLLTTYVAHRPDWDQG